MFCSGSLSTYNPLPLRAGLLCCNQFFMDVIAGKYRRAGDPAFAAEDLIALWEVREDAQGLVAGPSSTAPALRPVSAEALRRVKPAG